MNLLTIFHDICESEGKTWSLWDQKVSDKNLILISKNNSIKEAIYLTWLKWFFSQNKHQYHGETLANICKQNWQGINL